MARLFQKPPLIADYPEECMQSLKTGIGFQDSHTYVWLVEMTCLNALGNCLAHQERCMQIGAMPMGIAFEAIIST